ncbi:hypothetical protein FHS27_001498 [Rhodopirellula rubra]|uniref:Uncharacterized protein n=1 Tax=Aporhodopirellula rubra TaxID=980271 RepID=A0A7W5DW81_9BACT|nr:hypothetical protein [Aporhodopirellula rubra]
MFRIVTHIPIHLPRHNGPNHVVNQALAVNATTTLEGRPLNNP